MGDIIDNFEWRQMTLKRRAAAIRDLARSTAFTCDPSAIELIERLADVVEDLADEVADLKASKP